MASFFHCKRSQALWIHWSFQVWIRYSRWLDEIGISFFECDSCQALHLPHMQNFDGIFDAKIDLVDNVVLFSALAEVKPSRLLAVGGSLGHQRQLVNREGVYRHSGR